MNKSTSSIEAIKKMKKEIKPGLVRYMEKKAPGRAISTYNTYASDSNYLINNGKEDEFIRFMRSKADSDEVRTIIYRLLMEKRGEEKVTDGGAYYYEKLCWQREYIQSIGGIDMILSNSANNS